jgi:uncharacterized protein (TIGR02246 family)
MSFLNDVADLENRFLEAYRRGDAAACAALYTDDALYLVPGMNPVHGRKAIEEATAKEIRSGIEITRLAALHAQASGDLGYVVETFESSVGEGSTLLALRRDERGVWRICAEAFQMW